MNKKEKLVHAVCIDNFNIYTICTTRNCKEHIHIYGSGGDVSDRVEYRSSHCDAALNKNICIRIDETTKRACLRYYPNKSITISKRKYKTQLKQIKKKEKKIKIKTGNFTVKFN